MSNNVANATRHYLGALRDYNCSLVTAPEIEEGRENLAALYLAVIKAPENDPAWERLAAHYEMDRALSALKAAMEADNHSNAAV